MDERQSRKAVDRLIKRIEKGKVSPDQIRDIQTAIEAYIDRSDNPD